MEEKFSTHRNELEKLRTVIQNQSSVKFLATENINDSTRVIAVNGWYHRGKNLWELGLRYEGEIWGKDSFDEVLIHAGINQEDYAKVLQVMSQIGIEAINVGKEYFCSGCIQLEAGNAGLRYYQNSDAIFEPDDEYISVRKVSNNWYVYQKDWN